MEKGQLGNQVQTFSTVMEKLEIQQLTVAEESEDNQYVMA